MEVYLVFEYVDYEGSDVCGIFDNLESAEECKSLKEDVNDWEFVSYEIEVIEMNTKW